MFVLFSSLRALDALPTYLRISSLNFSAKSGSQALIAHIFLKLIYFSIYLFLLKDNCFAILFLFLPYVDMNQP